MAQSLKLALAAGGAAMVPTPFASERRDCLLDAIAVGGAEQDWDRSAPSPSGGRVAARPEARRDAG